MLAGRAHGIAGSMHRPDLVMTSGNSPASCADAPLDSARQTKMTATTPQLLLAMSACRSRFECKGEDGADEADEKTILCQL
jgi:hypothetical protein